MRRWLLPLVVINLLALIALVFAYPHLMVSPGPVRPAHASLATDCFACHSPFLGASPARCMSCHKLQDIGLRTTSGAALAAAPRPAFHQQLASARCMDCHTEHQGIAFAHADKPFLHTLLKESVQGRCKECHQPPATAVHQNALLTCTQCHNTSGWRPASFDHGSLSQAVLQNCASCHAPPANDLHRNVAQTCSRCHQTTAWKPASFDHSQFFALDGVHNAACATCHVANRYDTYTCYGCHAHTPSGIAEKHREEGILDIQQCARCHRSGHGENGEERERD